MSRCAAGVTTEPHHDSDVASALRPLVSLDVRQSLASDWASLRARRPARHNCRSPSHGASMTASQCCGGGRRRPWTPRTSRALSDRYGRCCNHVRREEEGPVEILGSRDLSEVSGKTWKFWSSIVFGKHSGQHQNNNISGWIHVHIFSPRLSFLWDVFGTFPMRTHEFRVHLYCFVRNLYFKVSRNVHMSNKIKRAVLFNFSLMVDYPSSPACREQHSADRFPPPSKFVRGSEQASDLRKRHLALIKSLKRATGEEIEFFEPARWGTCRSHQIFSKLQQVG